MFALALLCAPGALAERGVVTASLQAGQVATVTPTLATERAVPLRAALEYGVSERWSLAGSGGVELLPGAPTVSLGLGPHLTLFKDSWWALETFLVPEALWRPTVGRFEFGARLGLTVRYLLMWGVGVVLEGGVRGRADAVGPWVPALQGFLVGGLYVEA